MMLTAITEVTRNASTASRGLKMIASRLTQTLDESSGTGKKLVAIYKDLGISLTDSQGQIRSTYEILGDLSLKWESLSKNEREYIALTSAGANQVQNFNALMFNFGQAVSATTTAYNSSGSAMKENEKVMDTISKKLQALRSEFEKLVIGDGGLQEFAKNILDIGVKLLKFANSDIGKVIVEFVALESTLMLVGKAWKSLQIISQTNVFVSAIMSLIAGETTLSQVTSYLTATIKANTIAFLSNPLFAIGTAVVVGIVAVAKAIEYNNKALSEATEKTKELADTSKQTEDEIKNLEKSLKDIEDQLKRIEKQKLEITNKEQTEELSKQTNELTKQEESLRRQLALAQAKLEIEHKEEEIQARKALNTKVASKYADTNTEGITYVTADVELKGAIDAYDRLSKKKEELTKITEDEILKGEENTKQYKKHKKELDDVNNYMEKAKERGLEMAESVQTNTDSLYRNDEITKKLKDDNYKLVDSAYETFGIFEELDEQTQNTANSEEELSEELSDEEQAIQDLAESHGIEAEALKDMAKELGMTEEALVAYADSMGISIQQAYEYQSAIQSWNNSIDNLQSSYDTLTGAVDEYNQSGYITLDTLQSLLALSPEYLNMLTEENGKLVLNEKAIIDKVNALIEERKQTALQTAMDRLSALQRKDSQTATENQSVSIDNNIASLDAETQALSLNTVFQKENEIARNAKSKGTASEARKIVNELKSELAIIEKLGDGYKSISSSSTKAGKSAKSASKGATNALKEQNKELEKLKSNYEKVASYITSQLDKQIQAIEKEKNANIKAKEQEISALEREKDSALDAVEQVIKAREKERDTAIDNIEAEIKKIEDLKDERLKSLKKQKEELKEAQDNEVDAIEKKIDALEEERDATIKTYEAEIDELEKLKNEREKYWDEQIDALKKANEEKKDALELQEKLDALEKAKNTKVKVYKKGQGFVYDTDMTAVAEAQKELDEYLSEKAYEDELERLESLKEAEIQSYTTRLDALKDYKEKASDNYKKQIDALNKLKEQKKSNYDEQINVLDKLIESEEEEYERQLEALKTQKENLQKYYEEILQNLNDHKDSLKENYENQIRALEEAKDAYEASYDEQIKYYQNYKTQFEEMVSAYETQQNKLLFTQLTGLNAENSNWMTRLDNLAKFINEYNKLKAKLDTSATDITSGYDGKTKTTIDATTTKPTTEPPKTKITTETEADRKKREEQAKIQHQKVVVKTHADGISSIDNDEIAVVGENPNKEIVIGSKINNGSLMSLNKGTGVVNAKSTKSMAGLLNQVGAFGGSSFGSGNGVLNSNTTNNDAFTINGVTINGAGITDAQSFATALLNFKSEALQRAYKRK